MINDRQTLDSFISEQISGDWGKGSPVGNYNTKVYCVRGADISLLNTGNVEKLPIRYVEKKKAETKRLVEGNIVIEISGGSPTQSTGRAGYVRKLDGDTICSNFCKALKIHQGYNSKYCYYLLNNLYNSGVFYNFESKTSGIKNLLIDVAFSSIKVPFKNIDLQQKISSILSVLDDKIELNNKINTELEQMAKTLYDYWFVQFDFPDENGKPYKSSGGAMVYSEELKREIPQGWIVEQIQDSSYVIDCLHSKKPDYKYESDNYYLIQLENLREDGLLDISKKFFISKSDYDRWTSRIEVKAGDVLLTNAGRVAGFAQVPEGILTGIGRNITAIRPDKINSTYLGYYFKGADILRQIKVSTDTGSFFSSLNVHAIKKLYILRGSEAIEEKFIKIVEPVKTKRELIMNENQKLSELRDWLLPMLINGQVTVAD